jgi:hypothetical protein
LERPLRARALLFLPALLMLACSGNSDSAPGVTYDPTLEDDAAAPDDELDGGASKPPSDPSPIPIGGRRDAGEPPGSELDGSADATDAQTSDGRAEELGEFASVERLLVADGKNARVHVLDAPSRRHLDSLPLNGVGVIHAAASGRYGYVLERAQNLVQVVSMGLPELAQATTPVLRAPGLVPTSLSGLSPSAFASYGDDVTILFAGSAQLSLFDAANVALVLPLRSTAITSTETGPYVLLHLGDRVLVSERNTVSGENQLRVLDAQLSPRSLSELPCPEPEGAAQAQQTVAVGCTDGILLWNTTAATARKLRYPAGVTNERVHKLVASPSADVFMTQLGTELCLVGEQFTCVDAPEGLIDYAFDVSGKRALVLSRDGSLLLLEGETLAKGSRLELFRALPDATPSAELPGLAVGRRNVYVSDPSTSRVFIVDSATAKELARIEIPSAFPTAITVFKYDI